MEIENFLKVVFQVHPSYLKLHEGKGSSWNHVLLPLFDIVFISLHLWICSKGGIVKQELEKKKPVILTGDLNVANENIDIHHPAVSAPKISLPFALPSWLLVL